MLRLQRKELRGRRCAVCLGGGHLLGGRRLRLKAFWQAPRTGDWEARLDLVWCASGGLGQLGLVA